MSIQVGLCGFPVSRHCYFESFKVVELQQTFYHPPELATVRRWQKEKPDRFEYTMKAWQLITHEPSSPTYRRLRMKIPPQTRPRYGSFRPSEEVLAAWEKTRQIARILGCRIILFQCPASFAPTEENVRNLHRFFSSIERGGLRFAWEPRGSWRSEQVRSLCTELDLIHAVDPFSSASTHGAPAYYRLHGIGGYRYRYTEKELKALKGFCPEGSDAYVMFNNVSMYKNALEFLALLKEEEK
jgi:uncharacterized protein YecE (DUF72 family)